MLISGTAAMMIRGLPRGNLATLTQTHKHCHTKAQSEIKNPCIIQYIMCSKTLKECVLEKKYNVTSEGQREIRNPSLMVISWFF